MEQGRTIIYYGKGKGKSSAALGAAVRFAALGGKAVIIQFLKEKQDADYYSKLEPEVKVFRFAKSNESFDSISEEQRQEELDNIKNGILYARKVLTTGEADMVVLDELLGLVDQDIVSMDEVEDLIKSRGVFTSLILTGVNLSDNLQNMADEVYNISSEK
ncbi:MAG: cob(I)yrinic acid a,c-diamide adenosyltransferase [Lachnospiraceae bacterium]|nr:cob(I)yrinic acid a,c-diamide adenosyltransferase [Lachnospiraceae bacterium]